MNSIHQNLPLLEATKFTYPHFTTIFCKPLKDASASPGLFPTPTTHTFPGNASERGKKCLTHDGILGLEECSSLAKPHGSTHLPRIMFRHVYDLRNASREGGENEGGTTVPGRLWSIEVENNPNIPTEHKQTTPRNTVWTRQTNRTTLVSWVILVKAAENIGKVCGLFRSFSTGNGLSQSPHRSH